MRLASVDPVAVEPPPPAPGAWFVYVLWSGTLGRTYVGLAVDVSRRVRQHGGELVGGARTTRAGRPWHLAAWYGPFPDRGGATRAERAVKGLKGMARLRWVGSSCACPMLRVENEVTRPPEECP